MQALKTIYCASRAFAPPGAAREATQASVRSAPKVASESKIRARRDHLEQYFINFQISSKSQILGEFQQKNTFPSLRPHDKNLGPT